MGELSDAGLYRRATAAAFCIAPALLLIDNVLHPKEFARGHELEQVREIAEHATRWQISHLIGFAAILLFAAAVLGSAFLVRRRQPRLGLVAGTMAMVGLLGLAGLITLDGYTWGIVGAQSDGSGRGPAGGGGHARRGAGVELVAALLPHACGLPARHGRARGRGGPPGRRAAWTAGLLVLATLMTATETAIASNAYFIAGAAVPVRRRRGIRRGALADDRRGVRCRRPLSGPYAARSELLGLPRAVL